MRIQTLCVYAMARPHHMQLCAARTACLIPNVALSTATGMPAL